MTRLSSFLGWSEAAFTKLREFWKCSIKPVDEQHGWFFQIVFELMDAALT